MVGNLSAKWNTSKMSKSQNEKWRKKIKTIKTMKKQILGRGTRPKKNKN